MTKLTAKILAPRIIPVNELKEGEIAIAVTEFAGEIFFRNVAGLHSVGAEANRYWPSEYIEHSRGCEHPAYSPDFKVQLLEAGDTITVG